MHFLQECCFWTAAALMLFLGAEASPIPDSSGEEELSEDSSSRTSSLRHSHEELAYWLQRKAATWNAELCSEQNTCEGSMEMLIQNNLHLPKLTEEDGCFNTEFKKEKCLRRLASGLYAFQTYLEYIEEPLISNVQETTSIWERAQQLANTLKSMTSNPDEVAMPDPVAQKALARKLRTHRDWNVTVIKHFILQSFTSFMEKTIRAIRVL